VLRFIRSRFQTFCPYPACTARTGVSHFKKFPNKKVVIAAGVSRRAMIRSSVQRTH
jgi:hypothetical protein